MFFSRDVFELERVDYDSVCRHLSLPRVEYAKALLEWQEELSKTLVSPTETSIIGFLEQRRHGSTTLEISTALTGFGSHKRVIQLLQSMRKSNKIKNIDGVWRLNIFPAIIVPSV